MRSQRFADASAGILLLKFHAPILIATHIPELLNFIDAGLIGETGVIL
jgi:hypothetical protein